MKVLVTVILALTALQEPGLDAVVERMDAYLEAYQPRLSELVADETMAQAMTVTFVGPASRNVPPRTSERTKRRQLLSEVAFIALPNDGGWLGFRSVSSVDRKSLNAGRPLAAALGASNLDPARALLEASAQHNLGLRRTTNLPNLPLEFLHRRNRDRLVARADGTEAVRGVDTARIVFHERLRPTLIKHPNGTDLPSVVRAWVDPRDGRLLRAEVTTFTNELWSEHSVLVDFEHDAARGLLVPKEMRERFPGDPGVGSSVAVYSNYRRFSTSARIVPQ